MNRREFLRSSVPLVSIVGGPEGPPYISTEAVPGVGRTFRSANTAATPAHDFVAEAERLKPSLTRTVQRPVSVVEPVADPGAFLRWRVNRTAPVDAIAARLFKPGDSIVLDFGTHLTGHFGLTLRGEGRGIDAPARLKLTFGEVPGEIAEPFDPYKG